MFFWSAQDGVITCIAQARRPRGHDANGGGTPRHACTPRSHVFIKPPAAAPKPQHPTPRHLPTPIGSGSVNCRPPAPRQLRPATLMMFMHRLRGLLRGLLREIPGWELRIFVPKVMLCLLKTCDRGAHACLWVPPPFALYPRGRRGPDIAPGRLQCKTVKTYNIEKQNVRDSEIDKQKFVTPAKSVTPGLSPVGFRPPPLFTRVAKKTRPAIRFTSVLLRDCMRLQNM